MTAPPANILHFTTTTKLTADSDFRWRTLPIRNTWSLPQDSTTSFIATEMLLPDLEAPHPVLAVDPDLAPLPTPHFSSPRWNRCRPIFTTPTRQPKSRRTEKSIRTNSRFLLCIECNIMVHKKCVLKQIFPNYSSISGSNYINSNVHIRCRVTTPSVRPRPHQY